MNTHIARLRAPAALLLSVVVALCLVLANPGTSAAAARHKPNSSPVVQNDRASKVMSRISGTTETGKKVHGSFSPSSFEVVDGVLQATGEISGRIPGEGTFSRTVSMPVQSVNGTSLADAAAGATSRTAAPAFAPAAVLPAAAPGSCDILHLVLGPLDLDLLGLQVHLDKVVLDIVAKSGAGNLLGNLLCAVAGLLDDGLDLGALLNELGMLLNQILGSLGLTTV